MGSNDTSIINAMDFFCGGGGMTCGLKKAGINVVFGLDSNPACCDTYEKNNKIPYLCKDILEVTGNDLKKEFPIIQDSDNLLMVGCAPCQPFSLLQKGDSSKHISVNLLNEFGRIVQQILPAYVIVENVPGLRGRGTEVLSHFLTTLDDNGYEYDSAILNAKDYGVPQNRKRYILIASRKFRPVIPHPTHGVNRTDYVTVYDAIHNFPPIKAGETHGSVLNHKASSFAKITMDRIIATPHDGGTRLDWPQELVLSCHKQGFKGHSDVYGRMFWNRVSPTLTSKCFSISNGRFGHPEQNRAISLREAAAIQTFPDDYEFFGSVQEVGKQIGNAVPVLLAQKLGEHLISSQK